MGILDPQKYYDAFSRHYDRPRNDGYHAYLDRAEAACVREFAKGLVLEAGCGTGLIMSRLQSPANEIYGFDISLGMLKAAKERQFKVVQADITNIPFEDNTFDLVYSFKVLAHVPHIRRALAEMVRVTKPNGVIAAEFYNKNSMRYVMKQLYAGTIAKGITEKDIYLRFDTLDEFLSYFPKGVELIKICSARHCLFSPIVLNLPGISKFGKIVENIAALTPAKFFGGFVTVVLRKL